MRVIGITGGVGAGKSQILTVLQEEYGAEVIQADLVAKKLEEPGQPGFEKLTAVFGNDILDSHGAIDRNRFAQLIFQSEAAMEIVNAIIHPMTWSAIKKQILESQAQLVAVEAALFYEENKNVCQEIWYVDAQEDIRRNRLMTSRGYSKEKVLDIMKNQPSREAYLKLADVVIDSSGSLEQVKEQIKERLKARGTQT